MNSSIDKNNRANEIKYGSIPAKLYFIKPNEKDQSRVAIRRYIMSLLYFEISTDSIQKLLQ